MFKKKLLVRIVSLIFLVSYVLQFPLNINLHSNAGTQNDITLSVRLGSKNYYVSAQPNADKQIRADRDEARVWERFDLIKKDGNKYIIKARSNDNYVVVKSNKLYPKSSDKSGASEFTMTTVDDDKITLKYGNRSCVSLDSDKKLIISTKLDNITKFKINNSSKNTSDKPSGDLVSSNSGDEFKIWVVPDTQRFSEDNEDGVNTDQFLKHFKSMGEQVHDKNVDFILQVGDNTQGNYDSQWKTVRKAWNFLGSKVPYILNLGNHDTFGGNPMRYGFDSKGETFNKYFELKKNINNARLVSSKYDNTNVAYEIRVANVNWLIVSISWDPNKEVLAWADDVIKKKSNHQVIVVNHEMAGSVENIVKRYSNVVLFLGGHHSGTREQKTGKDSNKYGSIRTCFHNLRYDSYLTEVVINTNKSSMTVKSYSPYYNEYWEDSSERRHKYKDFTGGSKSWDKFTFND